MGVCTLGHKLGRNGINLSGESGGKTKAKGALEVRFFRWKRNNAPCNKLQVSMEMGWTSEERLARPHDWPAVHPVAAGPGSGRYEEATMEARMAMAQVGRRFLVCCPSTEPSATLEATPRWLQCAESANMASFTATQTAPPADVVYGRRVRRDDEVPGR